MDREPLLRGEHLTLRPIELSDAPFIFRALCEPEVSHWTGNQGSYSLEQVKAHCARIAQDKGRVDFAITQIGHHQYIGEAVLQDIDWENQHAHFRLALASPKWFGRGFGREATQLLLAHGFETMQLNRIELEVYEFNHRARALYEKLGFVHEGLRRSVLKREGVFHNAVVMSMLAAEHSKLRST